MKISSFGIMLVAAFSTSAALADQVSCRNETVELTIDQGGKAQLKDARYWPKALEFQMKHDSPESMRYNEAHKLGKEPVIVTANYVYVDDVATLRYTRYDCSKVGVGNMCMTIEEHVSLSCK
jgi:hypothetical protein